MGDSQSCCGITFYSYDTARLFDVLLLRHNTITILPRAGNLKAGPTFALSHLLKALRRCLEPSKLKQHEELNPIGYRHGALGGLAHVPH